LVNLVEAKADTVGEWYHIITELAPGQTEAECRAFLDRVRPKFAETSIFEVYRDGEGKWDIKIFDSRYSHWHTIWLHCREHGSEFEEARKAFLRGELEEFLVSKGSIEAAAV
jgi:hypothetical protein